MSDFGDVREHLHASEPSREAFAELVRLFRCADDPDEARRVWIPYAREQMKGWPLDARHVNVERFDEDELSALPLASSARFMCRDAPEDAIESLLWSPRIAGIVSLELRGARPWALEWLATSPHAAGLKSLRVNLFAKKGASFEAFATEPVFRLERFAFSAQEITDIRARDMLSSVALYELRELELGRCGLKSKGFEFLLTRPWFPGLTHFTFCSSSVDVAPKFIESLPARPPFVSIDVDGAVSERSVAAMIDAGWMDESAKLSLDVDEGLDVLHALMRRPRLEALEELRVRGTHVGFEVCDGLARSSLVGLRTLELYGPALSPFHVLHMLRSPGLPALESLHAGASVDDECAEDAEGVVPEDQSSCTGPLRLSMHHINVGPRAVLALARTRRVERATHFSVAFNPLGVGGARALGEVELRELETLDVENCRIGDEGLRLMLEGAGARFPRLTRLELDTNALTDASHDVLPASGLDRLAELLLWNNAVGAAFVDALVSSRVADTLVELELVGCIESDEVLNAVGRSRRLGAMRKLNMGGGFVGQGLRALIGSTLMDGLVHLQLPRGGYDDEVFRALVHSPSVRTLEVFSFYPVSLETLKACATSPYLPSETMQYETHPLIAQAVAELVRDGAMLNAWGAEKAREQLRPSENP